MASSNRVNFPSNVRDVLPSSIKGRWEKYLSLYYHLLKDCRDNSEECIKRLPSIRALIQYLENVLNRLLEQPQQITRTFVEEIVKYMKVFVQFIDKNTNESIFKPLVSKIHHIAQENGNRLSSARPDWVIYLDPYYEIVKNIMGDSEILSACKNSQGSFPKYIGEVRRILCSSSPPSISELLDYLLMIYTGMIHNILSGSIIDIQLDVRKKIQRLREFKNVFMRFLPENERRMYMNKFTALDDDYISFATSNLTLAEDGDSPSQRYEKPEYKPFRKIIDIERKEVLKSLEKINDDSIPDDRKQKYVDHINFVFDKHRNYHKGMRHKVIDEDELLNPEEKERLKQLSFRSNRTKKSVRKAKKSVRKAKKSVRKAKKSVIKAKKSVRKGKK